MFNLKPGIGLDKVKLAGFFQQELERAEVRELGGLGHRHGAFDDLIAQLIGQVGRRSDLEQFLPPALQAAFALTECHDSAAAVAGNLDFDMARLLDQPFHVERLVAERPLRFLLASRPLAIELFEAAHRPHAPAAAAAGSLDHDGFVVRQGAQECAGILEPGAGSRAR